MSPPLRNDVAAGIGYMVLGIFLLSAMDAVVKGAVESGLSPVQILALRSIVIFVAMMAGYRFRGEMHLLVPRRRLGHLVRGILGFTAPFCFFTGLKYLPLSDAVVVFFSATFMTTALSVFVLKEQVGPHRWAAVVVGYVGVVIAMRPEGEGMLVGYLLVLAASLGYAFLFVSGRLLSATESVPSLVFSFNIGVGVCAILLLPFFWRDMVLMDAVFIGLIAALALLGHLALTTAFSRAPASTIAPFEYTALLWAVLCDLIFWNVLPAATTWAGAVLIVGSGLYMIHRERLHEKPALESSL